MKPSRPFLPFILMLALLAALPVRSAAQPANALGVRITSLFGIGAELSYQRYLGEKTRLETDLGFRLPYMKWNDNRFILIATSFQWRWPIGRRAGFYAGPVIQFGRPVFGIGGGAQTGFDWQFDHFQLSVDVRPTYDWFWYYHFDACLSVGLRYSFGSDVASRAKRKSSSGK